MMGFYGRCQVFARLLTTSLQSRNWLRFVKDEFSGGVLYRTPALSPLSCEHWMLVRS